MGNCCDCGEKKKRKSASTVDFLNAVELVVQEILQTEQNYGSDLKFLLDKFLEPVRTEELFFDNTDLIAFHSVILDLVQVQAKFQTKLEKAAEPLGKLNSVLSDMICDVSDVFISSEKDFDIYSQYVLCAYKVQKVVSKSGGVEKIVKYFEKKKDQCLTENPELKPRCVDIYSWSMKPFQRVMLYPLMLERIEKKCDVGTREKEHILKAIQAIKNVGEMMSYTLAKEDCTGEEYKLLLNELGIVEYEHKQKT